MKIFLTSLILIILFWFGAKVKLVDATSQDWYGGRYESGHGTDYVFTLKARGGSDKLVLDQLWMDDDYYEVKAVKNLAKRSDLDFEKKDTLFIRVGKKYQPDKDGQMLKITGKSVKSPKEYDGVALLAYTWKGKRKYMEIKEFRILEKIIYP